jgi:LCP family protein required for cell wall assembly
LKPSYWLLIFIGCAIAGVVAGYFGTLISRPQLIPPQLRIASLRNPATILFLGVDVVYTDMGRRKQKIDKDAFTGRSDTILVARLDPVSNSLRVISIPRDTQVRIPGNGIQKINAANALGGVNLAQQTVSGFLNDTKIDHYVILNVHGLVDLVNELGGITVEVPKKMQYMDWTAKLKIDLEPGMHTLTGNQAMGFVRFRHDALGDIGRVQRQSIFLRAVLDKALRPDSWSHLPKLLDIAQRYISTDMSVQDMMAMANFVRGVPKSNQVLTMMPGSFAQSGDWVVEPSDVRKMVSRLNGANFVESSKDDIRIAIENSSSTEGMGFKVAKMLATCGYKNVSVQKANIEFEDGVKRTRIIAQKANPEDASLVRTDLGSIGDIVNASVGNIESSVTIIIGNDLAQKIIEREAALTIPETAPRANSHGGITRR